MDSWTTAVGGTVRSGNTVAMLRALAAEVAALRSAHPLAPIIVLVGSNGQRAFVSRFLARSLGAHGNLRVVTIHRLAAEACVSAGNAPAWLTPLVRARLVAQSVGASARPGWPFAAVAGMPGLVASFARTLDDLRQACVPPAGWPSGPQSATAGRCSAVRQVYAEYTRRLQACGLTDDAESYLAAAKAWRAGRLQPPRAVLLYGMYDVTHAQAELLATLAQLAPMGIFRITADTEWPLADEAAAANGSACVVTAADDDAEAREAVREVLAAAAHGARFHDIAIVAPGLRRVCRLAEELRQSGVPVACRLPSSSTARYRLRRLLDCLSPAAGPRFARRAVIDLASALAGLAQDIDPALVVRWSAESREAGVVGGDQWDELLVLRLKRLRAHVARWQESNADDGDHPGHLLARARESLAATDALHRWVASLRTGAAALPNSGPWEAMTQSFLGFAARVVHVAADDPAALALSELPRIGIIEESVDLPGFFDSARLALDSLTESQGSIGREGVAVLTPHQLRGLRFRTVIFTGLAEGGFPSRPRQDPLLPDDERERLSIRFGVRLELAAEREEEPMLLFGLARQSAEEQLILMAPRAEAGSGRQRLPSRPLVEHLERELGRALSLSDLAHPPLPRSSFRRAPSAGAQLGRLAVAVRREDHLLIDAREADLAAIAALSAERGTVACHEAYLEVIGTGAGRLLGRRAAGGDMQAGPWDGLLTSSRCRASLRVLSPFSRPVSPSAVQRYITCPFRFYLQDLLGVTPPEEPEDILEMSAADLGVLAHVVLQRVFSALAAGSSVEAVSELTSAVIEEECSRAEAEGIIGLPFLWRLQRDQLAADLLYAISADNVLDADDPYRPWRFELAFGQEPRSSVTLELEDSPPVAFRGRIDRIDRAAAKAKLRVIDYKTGRGDAEVRQLRDGRNIQLPVYLLAAERLLADAGLAVDSTSDQVRAEFRFVTGKGRFRTLPLEQARDKVLANLRTTVGTVRELVSGGVFPRSVTDPAYGCRRCDGRYACDELDATKELKRGAVALRKLVWLQAPLQATDEGDGDAQI